MHKNDQGIPFLQIKSNPVFKSFRYVQDIVQELRERTWAEHASYDQLEYSQVAVFKMRKS